MTVCDRCSCKAGKSFEWVTASHSEGGYENLWKKDELAPAVDLCDACLDGLKRLVADFLADKLPRAAK